MPDPLLGFTLQSFAPPVQPHAVSGAVALMSLGWSSEPPEPPVAVASAETLRRTAVVPYGRAVEPPLAFRALLHTKVRHPGTAV
jgi:hypothetical protein